MVGHQPAPSIFFIRPLTRTTPAPKLKMPKKKKGAKVKKTYVEGKIVKARHLPAMDDNGLSDPFVHILLDGREVYKTNILYKTRFPAWEEEFRVDLTGPLHILDFDVQVHQSTCQKLHITLSMISRFRKEDGDKLAQGNE